MVDWSPTPFNDPSTLLFQIIRVSAPESSLPAHSLCVSLDLMAATTSQAAVHHPNYYFPNGTHIFRVCANHFLPQYLLCSNS
jgi:hypothetical protein